MATDLKLFTLANLHEMGDGDLNRDFMALLSAAVKDCTDRPAVEKDREVIIRIRVRPKKETDGRCDNVELDVEVGSRSPAKFVPTHVMQTTAKGGLKYSPESPDNPDQGTLGFNKPE